MAKTDVVFLHPPSLYDFRRRPVIHGPISDVVPSSPIFEMYPIGFLSLSAHLERAGFATRIINVANKMLGSDRYDPEREIRSLSARAFAIDLHWLPHVQGSLALGEIVKKAHPDTPLIYGGYSATYFDEELIRYPFVDFVVKGDATEGPVLQLVEAIRDGKDVSGIPNLTYKTSDGTIGSNPIGEAPADTADVITDYGLPVEKSLSYRDLAGYLPFQGWLGYPVTAIFLYRGCLHNCRTCGGSRFTCERLFHRSGLGARKARQVAEEIKASEKLFRAPCLIVGDILMHGRNYADELLAEIERVRPKNEIALEFFVPPPGDFLERVARAIPKYNVEISPESHDEAIRRAFGRPFSNAQLEESVEASLANGCRRIDLFFMIGLPGQTVASVRETVAYCGELLDRFGRDGRLHPFIAPLAPFIDPGSQVWEDPDGFGYRLFARTLEEHRRLMESALSWKHFLNYETRWMTRDEIVAATYEAGFGLNELKRRFGLISAKEAGRIADRNRRAQELIWLADHALAGGSAENREWKDLAENIREANAETICQKRELNWPTGLFRFKMTGLVDRLLAGYAGRGAKR